MLLGEYRLSVDGDGRLALPSVIRRVLHEFYAPDDAALVLTMFFDHCLILYPPAEWRKMPDRLRRIGATPRHLRNFRTSAALCPLDGEGRVYLPHLFQRHAAIERSMISSRTKEALARKRSEGMRLGRPKGKLSSVTKLTGKDDLIREYLSRKIPVSVIAQLLDVNRLTVRHYIRTRKLQKPAS
jgi:division/cell wall cluster transcriptional repressor MraZ